MKFKVGCRKNNSIIKRWDYILNHHLINSMTKLKISITIDEELLAWLTSELETKRFSSISHGIEWALTTAKGMQNQPQTQPGSLRSSEPHQNQPQTQPRVVEPAALDLEALRNKWWTEKQIGLSIAKQGGIGKTNTNNIMQKYPDLFETKDECRAWLNNKLKIDPPPEIEKDKPVKRGIIPNRTHAKILVSSEDPAEPPKFTPNRSTVKCPKCGEEHLNIPGSPVKRCGNCGDSL